MDTHNSLKLCYSIRAFKDFRTVYLVNYRSELSNQEIKEMIDDPSSKWVGDNNCALVEYLCRKVAIEESAESLNNSNLSSSNECNINLNSCLAAHQSGDKEKSLNHLHQAIKIANEKFSTILNRRVGDTIDFEEFEFLNPKYYNNEALFIESMLPLYDIFYFYGRIFKNQTIRSLIKQALDEGWNIRYDILSLTSFLIHLNDSPSRFMKLFRPSEITVIFQAIFAPHQ